MAERLIVTTDMKRTGESSIFQRRIEFHLARKPVTAFINGSSDFKLETLNPGVDCSQRPVPSVSNSSASAEKKSDGGDLSEYGLDAELFSGITLRRIGAGLENLGNTCFLNSVLQCLTYTEPLASYMQSGKHKSSCHIAGFCAMCAIQNHVSRALQSTGRILAPKDLVMNLRCISRNFRNARQEDAHEYMVNLLESMHKCSLPSGVPSQSPSAYEKSLVHKIFGGRLRSQVKCTQCSYCSNKFDPFLDLSLEILKADSLRKALSHFTATEQLDGGERQYHCQRCKQKVRALKQLTVDKAPYVLTIHLKRFGSHVPGQKINKKVEFGPTLDLKPFYSGSHEGDLKYTLYGVLVHAGWSTHSGHYYCFVRTSTGMWHSLDDNRVVQVSERTVLEQKAYMLFYVRDKRNLAPKKPNNAVRKDNLIPSGIGNRGNFVSTASLKETVQNGPSVKQASLTETKITHKAEDSTLLKDPLRQHLLKGQAKGPSTVHSTNGQFPAEGLPQSASSSNKGAANTSHLTVANGGAKINPGSSYQGSDKNSGVPNIAPLDCSGSQNSLVAVKVTQKVGDIVDEKLLSVTSCERVSGMETEKAGLVTLSNQSGAENNQNKVISTKKSSTDKPLQKAKENGLGSKEMDSSSQKSMMNECVQKKALDHDHRKKSLKPKKKLMKFQSASLHLGSKLLLKASLRLCKKKKHKRKAKKVDLSQRQNAESSHSDGLRAEKHVKDSNGDSKINIIKGDFKDRFCLNTAVLATNEPPKKSSSLTCEAAQCDAREPDCSQDKIKDKSQNDLMNVLTRGLKEITVERWDGIETRSPNFLGPRTANTIGYVPDEWDEEYDRGKRKKVREHKNSFGGPNPFQDIASKKVHANKKARKMDKNSSANQPFRI
ncbi:Ubiquitin carboxyl-terminal hydrolases family 2 [Macleaya cordata]|uniref:Ubiquitin carboxyl-terminal hydrolase n=1 Tax=Macleaya cordata TaxID=56857 RepID=A0A200QJM5_MACCD|nr:Ubiquitin carboxyl-terminal hydrolases family 2 [Macleaya cordata]